MLNPFRCVKIWDLRKTYGFKLKKESKSLHTLDYPGEKSLKGYTSLCLSPGLERAYVSCMDGFIYCFHIVKPTPNIGTNSGTIWRSGTWLGTTIQIQFSVEMYTTNYAQFPLYDNQAKYEPIAVNQGPSESWKNYPHLSLLDRTLSLLIVIF